MEGNVPSSVGEKDDSTTLACVSDTLNDILQSVSEVGEQDDSTTFAIVSDALNEILQKVTEDKLTNNKDDNPEVCSDEPTNNKDDNPEVCSDEPINNKDDSPEVCLDEPINNKDDSPEVCLDEPSNHKDSSLEVCPDTFEKDEDIINKDEYDEDITMEDLDADSIGNIDVNMKDLDGDNETNTDINMKDLDADSKEITGINIKDLDADNKENRGINVKDFPDNKENNDINVKDLEEDNKENTAINMENLDADNKGSTDIDMKDLDADDKENTDVPVNEKEADNVDNKDEPLSEKEAINVVNKDTPVKEGETDKMNIEDFSVNDEDASVKGLSFRFGLENFDDSKEEVWCMTMEQIREYLLNRTSELLFEIKTKKFGVHQQTVDDLKSQLSKKNEEYMKLGKLLDSMYKDQVKYLKHVGVFQKTQTQTVCVSADMPWLPHAIPASLKQESLLLNGSPSCKTLYPSAALRKPSTPSPNPSAPSHNPSASSLNPPAPSHNSSTTSHNPLAASHSGNTSAIHSQTPSTKPVSNKTKSSVECIDLTDEADATATSYEYVSISSKRLHPAPLPYAPGLTAEKLLLKPTLKISLDAPNKNIGIVLRWTLPNTPKPAVLVYEVYGYQERPNLPITSQLWKKIGSIKAMPLPMSCTLTQFLPNFRYHFTIRALDNQGNYGCFSEPASILFTPTKPS